MLASSISDNPIILTNAFLRTVQKTETYYFRKADTFRLAKLLEVKFFISRFSEILGNSKLANIAECMFFWESIAKV